MLKGIPSIISPELLKILHEMGHGDELVIGDANYPAASNAKRLIRADGHGNLQLLEAILSLFPLDTFSDYQIGLMEVVPGDPTVPTIWDEYKKIAARHEDFEVKFKFIERFAFYDKAKEAYAIVATGEPALYAPIILKKGIIKPD
ncbi:MAG: RbsD/FucU domain-containing protein [Spirochaetales bacterium]|nr:RbsD/FucU domain-containing protein [Spirochaetales bacterium]